MVKSTFHDKSATIVQLATPRATAALHVLRISGAVARDFLLAHTRLSVDELTPRVAHYVRFYATDASLIDHLLCIYFPSPNSFTGEDVVELHCHGSLVVVDSIMHEAVAYGLASARPGEFSRRAFLNGKMTALQAEAIDALIRSQSKRSASNALKALEGRSGLRFAQLQQRVLEMLATLEVAIEFPEEDIPQRDYDKEELYQNYRKQLKEMRTHFSMLIENTRRGKLLDGGLRVVLAGAVNAGKSTLLNLLLGEDRAIVSSQAGSTRDYLSEQLSLNAGKVLLIDTAGIRFDRDRQKSEVDGKNNIRETIETTSARSQKIALSNIAPGSIEKIGIAHSLAQISSADLVVCLVATKKDWYAIEQCLSEIEENQHNPFKLSDCCFVINKTDLSTKEEVAKIRQAIVERMVDQAVPVNQAVPVILETSFVSKPKPSVEAIFGMLEKYVQGKSIGENDVALQSERQLLVCAEVLKTLEVIDRMLMQKVSEEEILEEFYQLQDHFAELHMDVNNEDVFDAMFSQFCIGK